MPKIGILLPGSTLYPSIGIDFLQGIKSCFSYYKETAIELVIFPIGFGTKEKEIYLQAEKWLLSENTDVVICYAEDRHAHILSPLFAAMGKLLLITNMGAHYPFTKSIASNTLFHSMNDCLHSFLTGKLCAQEDSTKKEAIVATSFYDGGYQHCHSMTNAFAIHGGEIKFNFISKFQKELFDMEPLTHFTQSNNIDTLLCIYSGDMARLFFEQIFPLQQQRSLKLFGSPMIFDNSPGDFVMNTASVPSMEGYTGWVEALDTAENKSFLNYFLSDTNKNANLFSLQGWEAALIVIAYLQYRLTTRTVSAALEIFRAIPIASPRGVLKANDNNNILGPAYLVSTSCESGTTVRDIIEDTSAPWQEMMQYIPDSGFSTWQNTYLCI